MCRHASALHSRAEYWAAAPQVAADRFVSVDMAPFMNGMPCVGTGADGIRTPEYGRRASRPAGDKLFLVGAL